MYLVVVKFSLLGFREKNFYYLFGWYRSLGYLFLRKRFSRARYKFLTTSQISVKLFVVLASLNTLFNFVSFKLGLSV